MNQQHFLEIWSKQNLFLISMRDFFKCFSHKRETLNNFIFIGVLKKMPILCSRWKRGQKVNVRWPRTRSRWRTRPDARAAGLTFTAAETKEEKVPRKEWFRTNSSFPLKYFLYTGNKLFSTALCRITTKLQYKESKTCFLEINQDLLNLIGVEVSDRLNILYLGIWAMRWGRLSSSSHCSSSMCFCGLFFLFQCFLCSFWNELRLNDIVHCKIKEDFTWMLIPF